MLSPGRLEGYVAIVTGGSSGIGLATCAALAGRGACVVIVGTNDQRIRAALDQLHTSGADPAQMAALTLDVRSESDMNAMVREALTRFGRIDALVACAGVGGRRNSSGRVPRPLSHLAVEEWDEILDTNLKGVFLSNRAVLPVMMRQRSGQIVNISSSPGGVHGQPFSSAYCASKFGVNGLTEALAAEVRPYGIRVQILFPDATDTPLIRNTTLAARLGAPLPPSRVANHILFLLTAPDDVVWPGGSYAHRPVFRRSFVGGTAWQIR